MTPVPRRRMQNGVAQPVVRKVTSEDIDEVVSLLTRGWPSTGREDWHCHFRYAWIDPKPCYGFAVEADGRIVGFLGVIYVDRSINSETARVANLWGWTVESEFRRHSVRLLAAAMRTADILTAFSLTPHLRSLLKTFGFVELNSHRLVFVPLLPVRSLARFRRVTVTHDHHQISQRLRTDEEKRLLEDHKHYENCVFCLIEVDGETCLIATKRCIRRRSISSRPWLRKASITISIARILYVGNAGLYLRHAGRINLEIMSSQRVILVIADKRFFPEERIRGTLHVHRPAFAGPRPLPPTVIDSLYSEFVLHPRL